MKKYAECKMQCAEQQHGLGICMSCGTDMMMLPLLHGLSQHTTMQRQMGIRMAHSHKHTQGAMSFITHIFAYCMHMNQTGHTA
jgi:hypothetical protein